MAWPAFLIAGGVGAAAGKVSGATVAEAVVDGITHMYKN